MRRLAARLAPLLTSAACAICAAPGQAASDRSWQVALTPAPQDLSLAQIAFPRAGRRRLSRADLEVTPPAAFGADLMALAAVGRGPAGGHALALLLVVNRPSPLLDPARVVLSARAAGALGAPRVASVENAFAQAPRPRPALCDLALHGQALSAAGVSLLATAGAPPDGLPAGEAIAQAYDLACGLPYSAGLRAALAPPVAGCSPCVPQPGTACPLLEALPSICAAASRPGAARAAAASH